MLTFRLYRLLPSNVWNEVFDFQIIRFHCSFVSIHSSLQKKLDWLILKRNRSRISGTAPIVYYWHEEEREINSRYNLRSESCRINHNSKITYSSVEPDNMIFGDFSKVNIVAENFPLSSDHDLLNVKNDWFVNLSSKAIPDNVISLLQLGSTFNLPPRTHNKFEIFEIIKDVEHNIKNWKHEEKIDVRSRLLLHLEKFMNSRYSLTNYEREILRLNTETKFFLK